MKDLMRSRDALLRKLALCSNVVRGSVNSVCAKCNRAGCICEEKTSRRAYRLTYKDNRQKTRIVYIPRNRLPRINRMIANYSRLWQLIEELIETNIAIFNKEKRS